MRKVLFIALCFIVFEAKAQVTLTPYFGSVVSEYYNGKNNLSAERSFDYRKIDSFRFTGIGPVLGLTLEHPLSDKWTLTVDYNLTYSTMTSDIVVEAFDWDVFIYFPQGCKILKGGKSVGLSRRHKNLAIGAQLAPKFGFVFFNDGLIVRSESNFNKVIDLGTSVFVNYNFWNLQAFAKVEHGRRLDPESSEIQFIALASYTQISVGLGYRFLPKILNTGKPKG
jgi:hypothetical protein